MSERGERCEAARGAAPAAGGEAGRGPSGERAAAAVAARVAAGGLLDGPVAVLLSGGRDSVCLLDLAVRLAGPVVALHVNYGLRAGADGDEAHCRALCERLGVALEVRRAGDPHGNVQAWAREYRYAAARELEGDIATGHTATDQVETVLYRLAASPGRRALLGMEARNERVIRPLLTVTRAQTTAYCEARNLPFRDDPTNSTSARGHIRDEILPLLQRLHPAATENILRTLQILRDEAEVLDALVDDARDADLRTLPPALARLVLQRLADEAGGPSIAAHTDALLALAAHSGTASHDLPGGLRARSEYGRVRIAARGEGGEAGAAGGEAGAAGGEAGAAGGGAAAVVALSVPGRAAFGGGTVTAERGDFPVADGTLAAESLGSLEVRAWRPGDRMRPLGLGGTKSLQDLFTDRKVPRARRHALPVVLSDGEIAWIPGVATGERFKVTAATAERVRLRWDALEAG